MTIYNLVDQGSPSANGTLLQNTLNGALGGDVINLAINVEWLGTITLPNRGNSSLITIQSASADTNFPVNSGGWGRVAPDGSSFKGTIGGHQKMAKITAPDNFNAALQTANPCQNYLIKGVEFRVSNPVDPSGGSALFNFVVLGGPLLSDISLLPNNIQFDRCLLWSGKTGPQGTMVVHGIQLHCKAATIINCYIYDFRYSSSDSQAINGYNGPGPYTIQNNYIEGGTECVIFGGSNPAISGMQLGAFGAGQSKFQYNLVSKNLAWNPNDPAYDGSHWILKNLFEIKAGGNILIDNNTFQHCWVSADQDGYAMVYTPRATPSNQGGGWTQLHDITITNNHILDCYRGFSITGTDVGTGQNPAPYGTQNAGYPTSTMLIRDNLWEDMWSWDHNALVTAVTSLFTNGTSPGVNTWTPAAGLGPGAIDGNYSSRPYTIQAGTVIIFEYPISGGFNPNWEKVTVTSVNTVAGTFTCTNAKSHTGGLTIAIANDESTVEHPEFLQIDGGFYGTGGSSNMTVGITIDHNTLTTRRASMLGPLVVIGGTSVYRRDYGFFSHVGFAFNSNLLPLNAYGFKQPADTGGVFADQMAPAIFQELEADGTSSIRNNLLYLTSLAYGVANLTLAAPAALSGGMVAPAGYTGPYYQGSGLAETNLYQPSYQGVFFNNWAGGAGGDYSLAASSPAKGKALDGTDIGCRNFVWYTDGRGPFQGGSPTPSATSLTSANITQPANEVSTVTVTGAGGTPTGQVASWIDIFTGANAQTQTLSGGQTTFTFSSSSLSVGTHTITANYLGDSIFAPSQAPYATATFTVAAPAARASRIFLNSFPVTIVYPANHVSSIQVTDNSGLGGTPTGNVIATLDNANAVTQTLTGGQTTFTFSSPLVGPHTLVYSYQGDSTFASTSLVQTFQVTSPPLTPTQVALATSTITFPANESVIITVAPGQGFTGTPTGVVVATLDNANAVTQTLSGGQTSFTFGAPSVGTHQVAASYKGDATFAVSTGQGSFRVQQGSTGQPAQDSGVSGFRNAAAVTPNDNTDLANPARALYVGAAGNIVLNMQNGQTVTLTAVQTGSFVYLNIARIKSTGTTAGSLVALW